MKKKQRCFLKTSILPTFIACLIISNAQAANPLWTFTPASGSHPTQTVEITGTATVHYTVQNESNKSKNLVIIPVAGLSQTTPCAVTPRGQTGSICNLNLLITGSNLPKSGIHGGPRLCQSNQDGTPNLNQCYQPPSAQSLHITLAPLPIFEATITLNTQTISFVSGSTGKIQVTNSASSSEPASNILPSIPSSSQISVQSTTCGPNLAIGASCTITFTAAQPEGPTTILIAGTNTNSVPVIVTATTPPDPAVAVGYYNNSTGRRIPLGYTSEDFGNTWSLSSELFPMPGIGPNGLNGVSCSTTGNCAAVGYYSNGTQNVPLSYTSTDSGKTWRISSTFPPPIGNSTNILNGVSCNITGNCAAVGQYASGSVEFPSSYASSDFGNNWTTSVMPIPGDRSTLLSVSCGTTGSCAAVGQEVNGSQTIPLSYTSTDFGNTWSLSFTPPPPEGAGINNLSSVSCTTSGRCSAVGYYVNGGLQTPLSYISSDFGNNWARSNTLPPYQGVGNNSLSGVSCGTSGNCSTVGVYNDGSQFSPISYTSTDFGNTWIRSATLPPPINAGFNAVNQVYCQTEGRCVAVGSYSTGSQTVPSSYTSTDFGNTWIRSSILPPVQGTQINYLNGVS